MVLKGVAAFECSLANSLLSDSVKVKSLDGKIFERGKDYEISDKWGSIGRIVGGLVGENDKVLISYRYTPLRLDSVVCVEHGGGEYRLGTPASSIPKLPKLNNGEVRLLNIFQEPQKLQLDDNMLFPLLEQKSKVSATLEQQAFIPKTMVKLKNGKTVKILAWGDSVTEGGYLPEASRWQFQFVARLRQCFPQAKIELVSQGWPGKTMTDFLAEPSDSQYNYEKNILALKPDLIIIEFVNDAGLKSKDWEQSFPILHDFQKYGYEWIILTPHYVCPDWMGFSSQKGEVIENDPRPYVHYLRNFARKNKIALADTAKVYGQLWRCGLPYNTLMTNNINPPDVRGMKLFADVLMAIFETSDTNEVISKVFNFWG